MANTLTDLIPDLYASLDVVSRELVGFIPAVTLDASVSRAAVGQTVRSFVAPSATAYDITPATNAPDDGDQTIGNVSLTISKARRVPIRYTGEEELGLDNNGPGASAIRVNQFAQAMRTIVNEMESDLADLHVSASRAYGTAGTTPFNTPGDYTDASETLRILDDNGAPVTDRHIVVNTAAGAKIRGKQADVNRQGDDTLLRQGVFLDINGAMVRQSGQVKTSTAGTGSGYLLNGALTSGDTTITVDTGSGAILAGDVVTIGNYNYVVKTALSGGTFTINEPGIRESVADNSTVTVVSDAARNMVFSRDAIVLANRLPARPAAGDAAEDVMVIQDPRSGIAFEIAMYKEYRRVHYEVAAAWGANINKEEHLALLLG